ncbi:decapping and exoribonuclease protein-like [Ruditapes philippinarum]|uniref:decapping and exoribonuclease protein-like n=1 Tax=Ruditapes philippinarum TaxID=129788 RepID=UPI00295ACBE0|nr:decapping and exoribonuclease protein-like [Ruditapes philippinarum]
MDATNHQGRKQGGDQESTDKEVEDLETEPRGMETNKSGECLNANPRKLGVDFVCRRGLLTKVMLSPYEDKEGWFIAVVYYNGTYYLNEILTEERKKQEAEDENNKVKCMGWKFEQYLTADTKDGRPKTDVPYNNCEKFYTVVKTEINMHSLVYSGEIDALNIDDVYGNYYMEFKTTKEIAHDGHIKTFKRLGNYC